VPQGPWAKSERWVDGKDREREYLLRDNHQQEEMMIMIVKTPASQVHSPVVEEKRREEGGRKMRDLHKDTK